MLISNYEERLKRTNANKTVVLSHLALFRFSSSEVLREALGLSRSGTYKVLSRLEQEKMIRSRVVTELGIRVFGLTEIGAFECWAPAESNEPNAVFDLTKVPILKLRHELKTQLIKVKSERMGWYGWVCEHELPRGLRKYPDGLITSPDGKIYAVEVELNVKSKKRIGRIMYAHLKAISEGHYDFILYICPDDLFAKKLQVIFCSIGQVRVSGRKVMFEERHHRKFIFQGISSAFGSQEVKNE